MRKIFLNSFLRVASNDLLRGAMLLLCALIVGSGSSWAAETTIASWGKVSISANTAILASGGDSNNNGKAQFSSTKAMTSAGTNCYYGGSAGGAVITFSNLDLSNYKDITMTFYTRASQQGTMQIAWSSDGSSYTNLNAPSITTSEAQKTSSTIPNTAKYIKLSHNKSTGSLYFGKPVFTGTALTPSDFAISTSSPIDIALPGSTTGTINYSTTSTGTITWASSAENVASVVDNNDGTATVTAHQAGTTTITAVQAGDETYASSSEKSITINVSDARISTTITITPSIVNTDLNNGFTAGSVSASVTVTAGGALVTNAVSWSSSDPSVAAVNSSGVVTLIKKGSTKIRASYAGDETYAASFAEYSLSVLDSRQVMSINDISLNSTFFGCDPFTSWTTGMATSLEKSQNSITFYYGKGTSGNMYCNADKIRYYDNNIFSITAPDGYYITEIELDASIGTASPAGNISDGTWTGSASSVSFTFSNKTDITSATVVLGKKISTKSYGWASMYLDYPAKVPTGTVAYWANAASASEGITLVPITEGEVIPAYTGVVIKGEASTAYTFAYSTSTPAVVSGNCFRGTTVAKDTTFASVYVLAGGDASECIFKLYRNGETDESDVTLGANKAYLPVGGVAAAPDRMHFIIENTENATDIQSIKNNQKVVKYFENGQLLILRDGITYDALGRIVK